MAKELPKLVERAVGVHTREELLRIREGKVAIVGMGCDGCEVADQLVRTGVGKVTLIDGDEVEETNLNRQRLYTYPDIRAIKVYAAQRRLRHTSPYTKVKAVYDKLTYDNGSQLLKGHDVVVQGLDGMCARMIAHEICRELDIPIVTMSGQPKLRSVVSTVLPGDPLYQELFSIELEKPLKDMSDQERRDLDYRLVIERAEHAVEQGADPSWLDRLRRGETSWSITLGRAPVTGTFQSNEVIKLLTGAEPKARAPKIAVYDGNGLAEFGFPNDWGKILEPDAGKYWDYRMF
ncbi:ThiF family adenylyltransferase [Candidatus Woesearchaeota archaeon]|nr:ThiF family adenylyltransferase [Candidatus Woesearchaeota archaeon]